MCWQILHSGWCLLSQKLHSWAAYLRCAVQRNISKHLWCFQCQQYGHFKTTCRGYATCLQYTEVGHDRKSCERAERCGKYIGDHATYFRSCSNWISEEEILTVKITQKVSYHEACKLFYFKVSPNVISYSSLLK